MSHNKDPQIFTVEEIAKFLRKKERTIREMCYNHQIPHYKVGRTILFRLERIMDWLENDCRVDPRQNQPALRATRTRSSSSAPALTCSSRPVTAAQG